jgi:hypothetical protein
MKCDEVQSHFSDYLDKAAEGPPAKGIETHLTNCPICSEEFAGLLQCRQLVSALPEVEPPLGFTVRVMANVAEIASETSLWKRLFSPLKIRIPLQATAVMLIGVLSFYVYERTDYSKAPEPTARENFSPMPGEAPPIAKGTDKPSPAEQDKKAAAQTSKESKSPSIVKPASHRTAAVPVPEGSQEVPAESRRSFPIPAQPVVAGGVSGPIRIPRQQPFRLFPAERETVNLGEPTADYELLVRARPRRSQQADAIENSAEKSARPENSSSGAEGGRLIDLESSSVLNILWYTVPQDQYGRFKDELAAQARIESEVPIGIRDRTYSFRSDAPLFIKVVVLAPTE